MTNIHFACGEFVPGKRRIPEPRITKPIPPVWVPVPPAPLPHAPRPMPPVPVDYWVCICNSPSPATGPCTKANRQCVPKNTVAPGTFTSVNFLSKADCERTGFGLAPCHIETFKCFEQLRDCPPFSRTLTYFDRQCVPCGLARDVSPECPYDTLAACRPNCVSTRCVSEPQPPRQPVDPPPSFSPPRGTVPTTPTSYYGCVEVSTTLCPDGRSIKVKHFDCKYRTTPGAPYIYRNINDCKQICQDQVFRCPDEVIPTQSAPPLDTRPPNQDPIASINMQVLTRGLDPSVREPSVTVLELDSLGGSVEESNTSGGIYHKTYTFFDYSSKTGINYVTNSLYRNIFADLVAEEVGYLLSYYDSSGSWNEKYITGLTKEKIIRSINGELYQAFTKIKHIDGQKMSTDLFLGMVMRHLLFGTLNQINERFYLDLAARQSLEPELVIRGNSDLNIKKKAALGYLTQTAKPVAVDRYISPDEKVEAARQKFLLTDVESSVTVEIEAELPLPIELEDPGVSYSDPSGVENYVPQGPGDGYYIVIEEPSGDEEALELDTAVSASYYQSPDVRKVALNSIGESEVVSLSVSSSFLNSEFSSGFSNYTASAQYFKLDLSSIQDIQSQDGFINNIYARYVLLTDPTEIAEHSRDFGAKASIVNVQYSDPFYPYAVSSAQIEWRQKDLTFRNFSPSRSSSQYSILTRNMPDAIVLRPVSGSINNPLYGESRLDAVEDTFVTRTLQITPHFGLTVDEMNRSGLKERLVAEDFNDYQIGLVGIVDTQNIYYPFDTTQFPESFEVTTRPIVGYFYNDLLENTLSQKYQFEYLTWWDVYRRLSLSQFSKFIYTVPDTLIGKLSQSWRGYIIKDVLQRESAVSSNLTEINPAVEDSIYVTESSRDA